MFLPKIRDLWEIRKDKKKNWKAEFWFLVIQFSTLVNGVSGHFVSPAET